MSRVNSARSWKQKIGQLGLLLFAGYLLLPGVGMPPPLPNSPQSQEPGDVKDLAHYQAFYTDLSRAEIMDYYQQQFKLRLGPLVVPNYRLNYPPEEARWYVNWPLHTSYLEEVVYPLRESLFINGFSPKPDEGRLAINGQEYTTKVTVRYYTSKPWLRLAIGLTSLLFWWYLARDWVSQLIKLLTAWKS